MKFKVLESNCGANVMKGIAKSLVKYKDNFLKKRKIIAYKFFI